MLNVATLLLLCMRASSPFLRGTDQLSIITFDSKTKLAKHGPLESFDWEAFESETRADGKYSKRAIYVMHARNRKHADSCCDLDAILPLVTPAVLTCAAGNTAARDGVRWALEALQRTAQPSKVSAGKQVINYLLAFTDGADNCSITPSASLRSFLHNTRLSNFHMTMIAAGLDDGHRWGTAVNG